MTDELKTLRELRDAVAILTVSERDYPLCEEEAGFYNAAHAALGENGCITRELERITHERDTYKTCHAAAMDDNELRANELSALRTQHEALVVEHETLKNKAYDLEHVSQHWETDSEGWKDFLEQLEELAIDWEEGVFSDTESMDLRGLIKQHKGTP